VTDTIRNAVAGRASSAHTRDCQASAQETAPPPGTIFIPGGTFRMGSDKHYPEEAPVHRVTVDGFWIDCAPVTNREFRKVDAPKACCIPENPRGGREEGSYDPCQPDIRIPRKAIKDGSHLCAPNYCRRSAQVAPPPRIDTSTSHLGFRCIIRERKVS
jgi:formylglycine-generating enzyme required for sulfatase activity